MSTPSIADRRAGSGRVWALHIAGAVLLAAMAWIHLDPWSAGYRDVDVIGPAFLLDAIAGFGLAVLTAAGHSPACCSRPSADR